MHDVKNLTKQVLLLRLNSGAEVNIPPLGRLPRVVDSELRDNRMLRKLKELKQIEIVESVAAKTRASTQPENEKPHGTRIKR